MKPALFAILALAAGPAFAAVNLSMGGLVNMVIYLLILAAVCWLLLFIVGKWTPPEPFNRVIPAIIYTVAALILIFLLLDFVGFDSGMRVTR